tara:strand:+ start:12185 stop:13021 length:837 start_codon:yes stop_codon:yes gene_type:complete
MLRFISTLSESDTASIERQNASQDARSLSRMLFLVRKILSLTRYAAEAPSQAERIALTHQLGDSVDDLKSEFGEAGIEFFYHFHSADEPLFQEIKKLSKANKRKLNSQVVNFLYQFKSESESYSVLPFYENYLLPFNIVYKKIQRMNYSAEKAKQYIQKEFGTNALREFDRFCHEQSATIKHHRVESRLIQLSELLESSEDEVSNLQVRRIGQAPQYTPRQATVYERWPGVADLPRNNILILAEDDGLACAMDIDESASETQNVKCSQHPTFSIRLSK